jgi:CHAD domain-containing protein
MLKSPYNIEPDATFSAAANVALRTQAEALHKNLDGTRDGDVESLHDMRVASRRLRAAMSVFAGAYPPKRFRPLEQEASRITDALGEVRDADVQIEYLTKLRDAWPPSEQVGLEALIAHLDKERDGHRSVLLKELDRLTHSSFWDDLEAMTSGGGDG